MLTGDEDEDDGDDMGIFGDTPPEEYHSPLDKYEDVAFLKRTMQGGWASGRVPALARARSRSCQTQS